MFPSQVFPCLFVKSIGSDRFVEKRKKEEKRRKGSLTNATQINQIHNALLDLSLKFAGINDGESR